MSVNNATPTNLDNNQRLLKLPSIGWLFSILQTTPLILLSLVIFTTSYTLGCYFNNSVFISGAGTIIGVMGLLLTIKHNLLSSILNIKDAYNRYYGITSGFQLTGSDHTHPALVNPVIVAIKEEYVGILLTIIGSIVSGFGSLLPLIVLCRY